MGAPARRQQCRTGGTLVRRKSSRSGKASASVDVDQRRGGRDPGNGETRCASEELRRARTPRRRVVRPANVGGTARNQANPMTGSRVQQTCKPCAEEAAEVGQNDKGGTCSGVATPNLGQPRVDAHGDVGGGAIFEELQERNLLKPRPSGRGGAGSKRSSVSPKGRRRSAVRAGRRKLSPYRALAWGLPLCRERPTTHSNRYPATCKRRSTKPETNPGENPSEPGSLCGKL
jgi:hypothetical protein